MKRYIIFGTGDVAKSAYKQYGKWTAYFVDSNPEKVGGVFLGLPIRNVLDILTDKEVYEVIIASTLYHNEMEKQLLDMGVTSYLKYGVYRKKYGGTDELVCNPYEDSRSLGTSNEKEWIQRVDDNIIREKINEKVEELYNEGELFNHVEIETVNRCNGTCDFCPVNKRLDTREYHEMKWELFDSIIEQLSELRYGGDLFLYSNNEPFLDKTIIEKHKLARKKLPYARLCLFTNGTLLNIKVFTEIIQYLDELVIDNYNQNLELIKPCKEIVEYSKDHPEIVEKVTIVLRKPKEILTSRGGDAPNRSCHKIYYGDRCLLPFRQLIIRPDGNVSLCCNDPLGKFTMGNVNFDLLVNIWNNEKYKSVRKALYKGRENLEHCKYCDTFYLE